MESAVVLWSIMMDYGTIFFGCRLHFGLLKLKITVNHMKKYEKIQFMRII